MEAEGATACLDSPSEEAVIMVRMLFASLWLLAFSVAATAETRVEINHAKNFLQYKTFSVEVEPTVLSDGQIDEQNTIAQERVRRAVTYQLQARGLRPAESGTADLNIKVSARETERTEIVSSGWPVYPYGWYGAYGYGGYWGGPGYYWGGNVWTYRYIEAVVTYDVIEQSTGDLVYRAQRIDDVDHDDLDEDAQKNARKAFKKFPIEEFD
jgi:hypothetical protein